MTVYNGSDQVTVVKICLFYTFSSKEITFCLSFVYFLFVVCLFVCFYVCSSFSYLYSIRIILLLENYLSCCYAYYYTIVVGEGL